MSQYFVGLGEFEVTSDPETQSLQFGPGTVTDLDIVSLWINKSGGTADVSVRQIYPHINVSPWEVTWIVEFTYGGTGSANMVVTAVVSDDVEVL